MNGVIFDANIWVSFLNKEDNKHKEAVVIFENCNSQIILPEYIILEICTVLKLKCNKDLADDFLNPNFSGKYVNKSNLILLKD